MTGPQFYIANLKKSGPKYLGFVRLTEGGLWRAWSYQGFGYGPFESKDAATGWLYKLESDVASA